MPLKCLSNGNTLYAFDFTPEEWLRQKTLNRADHHLRMPCCSAAVVLKTSKLGTRFFAHARSGECQSAPESAQHLLAKKIIAEAVRTADWEVTTEHIGTTPDGERWVADVLATKGAKQIAIEVQLSRQNLEETMRRQERYDRSGVRGLWLLKHADGFPDDKTLPAFPIRYDEETSAFIVEVGNVAIPLTKFVIGALQGSLLFAPAIGRRLPVSLNTAPVKCWKCGQNTHVILAVEFHVGQALPGHPNITTNLYAFDEIYGCNDFLQSVFDPNLLRQHGIGKVKNRYSRTDRSEYLSNGCVHCDALQGRFFDHHNWYKAKPTLTVDAVLHDSWAMQLLDSYDEMLQWWFDENLAGRLMKIKGPDLQC